VNDDFRDLLAELIRSGARFLVVGAHAMAVHGVPRATGDLDVWIDLEPPNAERVWAALLRFGAPVERLGLSRQDFETAGIVVQIGLPPRRVDLLTTLSGLEFVEAWGRRTTHTVAGLAVPFLGRDDLVRNKECAGRAKDLADLELLRGRAE
jgi:hypothetical protein